MMVLMLLVWWQFVKFHLCLFFLLTGYTLRGQIAVHWLSSSQSHCNLEVKCDVFCSDAITILSDVHDPRRSCHVTPADDALPVCFTRSVSKVQRVAVLPFDVLALFSLNRTPDTGWSPLLCVLMLCSWILYVLLITKKDCGHCTYSIYLSSNMSLRLVEGLGRQTGG